MLHVLGITHKIINNHKENHIKDGMVYRGPAEVLATSSRMEGAFLSHGGLLIRAAWEDCIPCEPPTAPTRAQAAPCGGSPDGGLERIPEEELDERDDDEDAVPQIIVQPPLFTLGPGSPPGYGASAHQPGPSAVTLVSQASAAALNEIALMPCAAAASPEPADTSDSAHTPAAAPRSPQA